MVKTDKRIRLCVCFLLFNIAFIWGNSLMPAEASKAISGFVRDVVSMLLGGVMDTNGSSGEGILRKIAHFVEFACLGGLLCWLFSMLGKHRLLALASGFAVACVDETIQRFGASLRGVTDIRFFLFRLTRLYA